MRISNSVYGIDLVLEENINNIFVIEDRKVFSEFVNNFWIQSSGGEGFWILYEAEETYSIVKTLSVVINPFAMDLNDKKILNSLYKGLATTANSQLIESNAEMNSALISYIDKLISSEPYLLDYSMELDIIGLLKLYDVRFCENDTSLVGRTCSYIKLMHQICGINVFVFINLKDYISDEELCEVYKISAYEKVHLILIESRESTKLESEKVLVLDEDMCFITY